MIASQTVFLTIDRKRAVLEGDKDAQYLLVRAGHEITDALLAKYEGAEALVGGTKKIPRKEAAVETRTPAITTRDPAPAKRRR